MRWKTTPLPKPFDTRTVVKFAFLPTRINDTWIWLESYVQYQFFGKYGRYWIDETERRELINAR